MQIKMNAYMDNTRVYAMQREIKRSEGTQVSAMQRETKRSEGT